MKQSKRISFIALISAIVILLFSSNVSAYNIGDVIGYAQPTDIIATINGYQLNSYNVDGYTYIVVEDLRYFGMDVIYDNNTRTLSVARNFQVANIDPTTTNPEYGNIGTNTSYINILYTDIISYVNGNFVNSYNINGATIIKFDELAHFGQINYDNTRREISLTIADVNVNPIDTLAKILDKGMNTSTSNSFNNTYKPLAPESYCNVMTRARGNLVVVDFYIYGYSLTPEQITNEKQGCLNTNAQMVASINSLKLSFPTLQGILFNMYDGTGTCVVTHLYNWLEIFSDTTVLLN